MVCDPNQLLAAAKCFQCLSEKELKMVSAHLLCQISGSPSSPASIVTTPSSVDASSTVGYMLLGPYTGLTGLQFLMATNATGFNITLMGSSFTTLDFPNLTEVDPTQSHSVGGSSIIINSNSGLTTLNFPELQAVGGAFRVEGNAFVSLTLPQLATVGSNLTLDDNHSCTSMSFPMLTNVAGNFDVDDCRLLTLSAPLLATVGGFVNVGNNSTTSANGNQMASVSLPKLISVGNTFDCNKMSTLTSMSLPLLATVAGAFTIQSDSGIISLSLPSLAHAPNLTVNNNAALATLTFTSLSDCNVFQLNSNALTTLTIPASTGDGVVVLDCHTNPGLVFVTVNALFQDGPTVNFVGCALNAASVNQILHQCVASGIASGTIDLSGGTNAAPTGQGIADKVVLISAGVSVTTN